MISRSSKFYAQLVLLAFFVLGGQSQALFNLHLNVQHTFDPSDAMVEHVSVHEHGHSHEHDHPENSSDSTEEDHSPANQDSGEHHAHCVTPSGTSFLGPVHATAQHLAPRLLFFGAPLKTSNSPVSRHLEPVYRPPKSLSI